MPIRTSAPAARFIRGTELVTAQPVHLMARRTQTLIALGAGERVVIDGDFGGLIYGHLPDRLLGGQPIPISFTYADLAGMTRRNGSPVRPAPARHEAGYLRNRTLLELWDFGP